ncbi:MAG: hypothetical protein IJD23_02840 [Spirochaetaceae bacterium]|nr:hypothetical protein [Spirochaetaceae bacterium]
MKYISKFIFMFACVICLITFISCNNDIDDFKPEEPDYVFSNFEYGTYYGYDEYNNYVGEISFNSQREKSCTFSLVMADLNIPCTWTEKDDCATITGTGEYSELSFTTTKNTNQTFSVTFSVEVCQMFDPNATKPFTIYYNLNAPYFNDKDDTATEIDWSLEETEQGVKFTFTIPDDPEKIVTDIYIYRCDKDGSKYSYLIADIPSQNYPTQINNGTITIYDYFVEPGEYVYYLELINSRNSYTCEYYSKNSGITVKNPGLYSDLEKVSLKLDSQDCINMSYGIYQTPKEIDSEDFDNQTASYVYKWDTVPSLTAATLPAEIEYDFRLKLDLENNPDDYSGIYVGYYDPSDLIYWNETGFTFIEGNYIVTNDIDLSLSYQDEVPHGEQTLNVYYSVRNSVPIKDTILEEIKLEILEEDINKYTGFSVGTSDDGNTMTISLPLETDDSYKKTKHIAILRSDDGNDYENIFTINAPYESYLSGSIFVTDYFVTPGKEYSYICRMYIDQSEDIYDEENDRYINTGGDSFYLYSNAQTKVTSEEAKTREVSDIELTTADITVDKYTHKYKWNSEPEITGIPESFLKDYELKLTYKLNDSSFYTEYIKDPDYEYRSTTLGTFIDYSRDDYDDELEKGAYTLDSVVLNFSPDFSTEKYGIRYEHDFLSWEQSLSFDVNNFDTFDLTKYVPPYTLENTSDGVKITVEVEEGCDIRYLLVYRISEGDSSEYYLYCNETTGYSAPVTEATFIDPYVKNDKTYKYYCNVCMDTPESYYSYYYTEEKEIIVSGVTNPFDASDISVTKPELNFDSEAMTYSWTTVPELTTELPEGFDWNYYIKYNYIDEYDRTYTEYFSYDPGYDSPEKESTLSTNSGYTYSYLETYLELKKYESSKEFTIKIPVDVLPDNLPLEIIGK